MRDLLHNWVAAVKLIGGLALFLWGLAVVNAATGYQLNQFGIFPRTQEGLIGVLLWVFLHANVQHLIMNSLPLLFLGFFVALRGPWMFSKVTVTVWLLAGILVWMMGRSAVHVGASGLVFGYFGFLIAIAMFERRLIDLAVASVVIFYYGGMIFGVLPQNSFISWEAHLAGLLSGVGCAKWYGKAPVSQHTR